MKLYKPLGLLLFAWLLAGCQLGLRNSPQAALSITSTPKANIFLDNKHIGTTPFYDEKMKSGEYALKLVPEGGLGGPWEARINLSSGILTVVSRELGDTYESSSGYVLSLEATEAKEKASFLAVSTPDGAIINIDSEPKGFAPTAIDNLSEGDHLLLVSSPGYIEKSIKVQLIAGYKLTANIQLAKSNQAQPTPKPENLAEVKGEKTENEAATALDEDVLDLEISPTPTPTASPKPIVSPKQTSTPKPTASPEPASVPSPTVLPKTSDPKPPYIIVQPTPTNWLNVRTTASTASVIITKINPGEKYAYLESNDKGDWIKIKLSDGKEGWVAAKYVKLVEK